MRTNCSLIPGCVLAAVASLGGVSDWQAARERAKDLCAQMTLEEKAGELMLYDYACLGTNNWQTYCDYVDANKIGAIMRVRGAAETRRLQDYKLAHSRLRIPMVFHDDITHGYRTMLPIQVASACSWDEALIERAEAMVARETASAGIQMTYAPTVDLSVDPRWGRISEISGEDPCLCARLNAARVRGFQGRTPAELADLNHIISCDKHFIGYASLQGSKDYRHLDFSRRELYETYLPSHRACFEAGSLAVMNAYTAFEGLPCNFSKFLMKTLLRGELGFDGQLMTDWTTLQFSVDEGASPDLADAAVRGLAAGVDMDMIAEAYLLLPKLVREGKVRESDIDLAVIRSLAIKYRMGLFDDPYRYCDEARERRELFSPANRRTALELVRESIVLLENDGILPLDVAKPVALAGTWADNGANPLWQWPAVGRAEETVTPLAGMRSRWGDRLEYVTNALPAAETVVLVLGEDKDFTGERNGRATLRLPDSEMEGLRRLSKAGKRVISVVMAGRPIDMNEIRALSAAVVYAWHPGTMGGEAIAEILSGAVNPSAKLCINFPRHVGQIPLSYREKRTFITCGYKDMETTPLYPFGYGRSYTRFSYSKPVVDAPERRVGEPVRVTVRVRNVGSCAGREIVQLYVRDEVASVLPRERELKDFASVTLGPGEEKEVAFTLGNDAFALYDEDLHRVVEPGDFTLYVGPDCMTDNAVRVKLLP